jgi:hypothetical protein
MNDAPPLDPNIATKTAPSDGIRMVISGNRENAPAAICRKVAQARDGNEAEVWGDGSAVRHSQHRSLISISRSRNLSQEAASGLFQYRQS